MYSQLYTLISRHAHAPPLLCDGFTLASFPFLGPPATNDFYRYNYLRFAFLYTLSWYSLCILQIFAVLCVVDHSIFTITACPGDFRTKTNEYISHVWILFIRKNTIIFPALLTWMLNSGDGKKPAKAYFVPESNCKSTNAGFENESLGVEEWVEKLFSNQYIIWSPNSIFQVNTRAF